MPHPTATLGATCTHGIRTRGATGQTTHAAHKLDGSVHCQPVNHSNTPTRVCVHRQPLQQRRPQASLEQPRLLALQHASQQVGSRAHAHQGLRRASSAETRRRLLQTRSTPSATAADGAVSRSGAQPADLPEQARREEAAEATLAAALTAWNHRPRGGTLPGVLRRPYYASSLRAINHSG